MTLLVLGTAWLAGIAVAPVFHLRSGDWLVLVAASGLAALLHRSHPRSRFLFLSLAILSLGAARLRASRAALEHSPLLELIDGQPRSLTGILRAVPEIVDRQVRLELAVDTIQANDRPPAVVEGGVILVRTSTLTEWEYGDRIQASGVISAVSASAAPAYAEYLARQGITVWMPRPSAVERLAAGHGNPVLHVLASTRASTRRAILRLFPQPEAALLSGILVGDEGGIPPELKREFSATGTSHIVAISGFNLSLLSSAVLAAFGRWLGARRGAWASAAVILAYTWMVGADPPVTRAAAMALLGLAARRLGRLNHGLTSLSVTAFVLTLFEPMSLGDIGFQLSFAATLGMMVLAPPLTEASQAWMAARWGEEKARVGSPLAAELFWSGLAAQAATLPLTVAYFGRLPWVSLIANPLVVPVQPAVMALAGAAALLGSVWNPLGVPLAWLAWLPTTFTIRVVHALAGLSGTSAGLAYPGPLAGAAYVAFLVFLALRPRRWVEALRRVTWPRPPATISIVALALAAALAWKALADRPQGRLRLRVLEVGEASAALIESPTGRFALINGGPSPVALGEQLDRSLPLFGRRLDWLILTSPDENSVRGLVELADRIPLGGVLIAAPADTPAHAALLQRVQRLGRPIVVAAPGQALDLGEGAELVVLSTGEDGAALELRWENARWLVAEPAGAMQVAVPSQVVVAPAGKGYPVDGGSFRPLAIFLSLAPTGEGPAHSDGAFGSAILRTDVHGWLQAETDGAELWVWVERVPDRP